MTNGLLSLAIFLVFCAICAAFLAGYCLCAIMTPPQRAASNRDECAGPCESDC